MKLRKMHLFLTQVAVKSCIYAPAFQTTVSYLSDIFTYNAKYFQTLSGEKCQSFANMLKLCSKLHEVAWQFNQLAYSSGLMFSQIISTIAFRSLFSSNRLSKRA